MTFEFKKHFSYIFRLKIMKVISQICDEFAAKDVFKFFPDNFTDNSILSIFKSLTPKFNVTMFTCKLFDKWTTCEEFFVPIVTEEGICYTFNSFSVFEMITNE